MQKVIEPGTEMRSKLYDLFIQKNISPNLTVKITEQMRGKTDKEKEEIAALLIADQSWLNDKC